MLNKIKKKVFGGYAIYLWSALFLAVVYTFSFILKEDNALIYVIYLIFAIPFYKHLEKLALICYLLSTIAFFFMGADEAVWSIYTIYCFIVIISMLAGKKLVLKKLLPLAIMVIPVYLSYIHSSFQYEKGLFLMLYNIAFAIIVALTVDFKKDSDTLTLFFPFIASIQTIVYFIAMLSSGTITTYGATLVSGLNHNALGISCAQLGTILGVKVLLLDRGKNKYYVIMLALSFFITFLTGSRNAFLGLCVALIITYIYQQKKEGFPIIGFVKFGVFSCVVLLLAVLSLSIFGFDLSRFDYVEVIISGGSNRTYLWSRIVPLIVEKYNIFGYGPSHYCSELIITPLVNRDYVHTHNLLIEAWGELGLVGLLPFMWLLFRAFRTISSKIKNDIKYFMLFALFVEMMINGIGESMFADIVLWLLLGLILSTTIIKKKVC